MVWIYTEEIVNNNIIKILILSSVLTFGSAGDIQGKITFDGKAPKMKSLRMDADPVCVANNEVAPRREWLILDENNGLKNVLVFVKESSAGSSLAGEFNLPENPAVIDQNGCIYVPHVLGVMVGQKLDILNSDGTLHNIHALPKVNKEFNNAMPRSKKRMTVQFDKSEAPFKIKCDVHPWMGAFIGVFDHPYFAVTGDDGSYVISGLEPGVYVIEAWHEKLGSQTANVTVGDSAANFTFTKPKKPKKK
jgi:plastocyanin